MINYLSHEIFLEIEKKRGGNNYSDKKEGIKGRAERPVGQRETGRGRKHNNCNNSITKHTCSMPATKDT